MLHLLSNSCYCPNGHFSKYLGKVLEPYTKFGDRIALTTNLSFEKYQTTDLVIFLGSS
jgi:hypothetical protein